MSAPNPARTAPAGFPRTHALAAAAGIALLAGIWLATPTTNTPTELAVELPATPEVATTAAPAGPTWEDVTVRSGDTLARILSSRGHDAATVHAVMSSGPAAREFASIRVGATLRIATQANGSLDELSYLPDPYRIASIRRDATGAFTSELVEKPTVTVTRFAEGVIEDSLFGAGTRAGVGDRVVLEIADTFGYDIDFALEVQQGDSFRVMYEEILVDGEKVRDGNILAAEFINSGKVYQAVRYTGADGRAAFYTPEGLAMRKAFLRTPVDFARISSRFNPNRRHPVLHTIRAHKGVDYAAGRGTPVRATGDGRVELAGNKGGYGRTVVLQHGNRYTTLYAHLDRFAKGIRNGVRVTQGQIIGYVGSTGMSTGPHLHYEFRVAGVHVDPLKVKTAQAEPIAAADKAAFLAQAARMVAMLDNFSGRTAVAQNTTPQAADGTKRTN